MNHHEFLSFKLEKNFKLYRKQYEELMINMYEFHKLDRLSMELDAIMFRYRYMIKHKKDLDKIPEMKKDFTRKAILMRITFAEMMYEVIRYAVNVNDNVIEDIFVTDVKLDQNYVHVSLVVISKDENVLNKINKTIKDDEVYDIWPNKYFRFYTDSYNDGIAKAFPELFENNEQYVVGTGTDKDVFVHSLTFQTGERCSLNCSYCVSGDAMISMADGTYKNIDEIEVGDMVMGFDEHNIYSRISPTEVTHVFHRKAKVVELYSDEILNRKLFITSNHMIMTQHGWKEVKDVERPDDIMLEFKFCDRHHLEACNNYAVFNDNLDPIDVYNIETKSSTYIANGVAVHNCYQFAKSEMRMTFDTAKTFIDHLLNDDYGYINRYNSPAIIIEFIGGEPLLEIDLTRQIYEYFLDRCYELNHPWFTLHRLSICSNGLQYFDEEVQSFFKEYSSMISFNISIDGNKELHDACRVQPNGEGSYGIDMMALNHFNRYYTKERNSKMTLAPSNITYLYDSVVDFIEHGMSVININCVFEEGWEPKHANIEYNQLKKLADYLLENDLEHIYIAIFNDRQEDMMPVDNDSVSCGGGGSMLSIRPNGEFYPCIRYMPTSVGPNRDDYSMGNVKDGMIGRSENSPLLNKFDHMTRRTSSTDICFECPLSNDCFACIATSATVYNNPDKRTTFACVMVFAEHLANVYYWNLMLIKHPEWDLKPRRLVIPDEWALIVIDNDELEFLKAIEALALLTYIEKQ